MRLQTLIVVILLSAIITASTTTMIKQKRMKTVEPAVGSKTFPQGTKTLNSEKPGWRAPWRKPWIERFGSESEIKLVNSEKQIEGLEDTRPSFVWDVNHRDKKHNGDIAS